RSPSGGYKREGLAEYVRFWLTTDNDAQTRAPEFTKWFEGQFLAEHADIRAAFDTARELATRWRMQGASNRARASVYDAASRRERTRRAAGTLRGWLSIENQIESAMPLHALAKRAENKRGKRLTEDDNPYETLTALRLTHTARAAYMVEKAMIDLAGNPVGPS